MPGIGIRDNFFDLGGHSLLAVSLAAQIENALGRPVPLPMLLRAQTIEALAAALRETGDRDRLTGLLKLGADDSRRLTPASSQSWCALEYVPPRSEVERRLVELWSGTLGVPNCGIRDNFFEVGGNSRLARELLGRIETAFGRKLTFAAFLQSPTIQSLAATLGQPEHCQVVPIQPEGSYPPLFVVRPLPLFRLLADRLGFQQPVLGLALPEGADDVCEIARNLVAVLRTRQPAGPYRLAGWCANGVVAYEMAQQLRSAGESVDLLVLFDTFNPASAPSLSPLQTLQREGRRYLADGRYHWETLRMIGPAEAPAYLGRRAVALVRGVSSGLTRQLWKSTPEKKAARRGYWRPTGIRLRTQSYPVAPYPGRVLLFSAVRSHARHFTDPSCGWSKLLGENLTVVHVPGDHLSMFLEPTVSTVAGELAAHLNAGRR